MAPFDPQNGPAGPDMPDYTNRFKPISEPLADKSKGIALSTAATGLEEGAKLGENVFEDWMKDKIHAGVDAIRESTTAAYESIRRSQVTGQPTDPKAAQTAGFTGSLAGGTEAPGVPEGLQSGLDKATQLGLAKSQGKANDTLYTGALNAMAKQLRAQYPGHRDFIDEQIGRITGINPANAYMQNLLIDINRAGGATKDDQIKKGVISEALKYQGNREVQADLMAYEHGLIPFEKLAASTAKAAGRDYDRQQNLADRTDRVNAGQDAGHLAEQDATTHAQQLAQSHINPVVNLTGLSSPATINKIIDDSMSGKTPMLGPKQFMELGQALQTAKRQYQAQFDEDDARFHYSRDINNPERVKGIKKLGEDQFDQYIQAVTDQSLGGMIALKRQNDMSVDEARHQAYNNPATAIIKNYKVLNEDAGPAVAQMVFQRQLESGKSLKDLESFYGDATRAAVISPDLRTDDNVRSLYNSIDAAKRAAAKGYNVPQRAYKDLAENVNLMLTTRGKPRGDDAARNVVDYMFNPQNNSGLMEQWGRDYTDAKGYHLGKFGIAQMLNRPEITDRVNELGGDEWKMYKETSERWFKSNVQGELIDLNKTQDLSKQYGITLSWSSTNHNLELSGPTIDKLNQITSSAATSGGKILPPEQMSLPTELSAALAARKSVAAINGALGNLSYIYSKDGTDINEKLFDVMQEMGYQPNKNLQGDLPQRVINAIAASSKTNQQRLDEAFKAAQPKKPQ